MPPHGMARKRTCAVVTTWCSSAWMSGVGGGRPAGLDRGTAGRRRPGIRLRGRLPARTGDAPAGRPASWYREDRRPRRLCHRRRRPHAAAHAAPGYAGDETLAELGVLVGFDDDLAGEASRSTNRVRGLLTHIHPALERVLGPKTAHPAVLELLSRCGGPTGLAKAGRRKLITIAVKHTPAWAKPRHRHLCRPARTQRHRPRHGRRRNGAAPAGRQPARGTASTRPGRRRGRTDP